ncbi:hypothetical protein ACFQO4_19520 [Saliphagus sp. GCM10025334]|uniref:hypothetical protein n=1 Tax=Natronosalvus caseinilyticus TaxID=2953747 RepID=UPI0028AA4449|nr:hypothetical protein [Natronosalvus caseinilyticus]
MEGFDGSGSCVRKVLLIFGCVLLIVGGSATASGQSLSQEVTGVSIGPIGGHPGFAGEVEEFEDTASEYVVDVPSEVSIIAVDADETYVVFSDEPIPAGEVIAEGNVIPHPDPSFDILIASDFEVDQSGDRISFEELRSNPEQYSYEVIELEASTSTAAFVARPASGVAGESNIIAFNEPGSGFPDPLELPPGAQGRWATLNVSPNELGSHNEEQSRLPEDAYHGFSLERQFWGHGEGTITAVAMPTYFGMDGDMEFSGLEFWVVDVNYDAQRISGASEIEERGSELEGKTVILETDVVGTTTSSQNFLTSVVSCGDQTVWIPTTPVCVPVSTDTVIHSGGLVDGTTVVPYAGFSSTIQNTVVEPEEGRYEITGEVVSASELEADVPGKYALVAYDMERTGDVALSGAVKSEANQMADKLQSNIEDQLRQAIEGEAESVDGSGSGSIVVDSPPVEDGTINSTEENTDEHSDATPNQNTEVPEATVVSASVETNSEQTDVHVEIAATLENPSNETVEKRLRVYANGNLTELETVTVPSGTKQITLETQFAFPGEYQIEVGNVSAGQVSITEPPTTDPVDNTDTDEETSFLESVASSVAGMSTPIGLFMFYSGVLLFLGVAVVELMRTYKEYFSESEVKTSNKPGLIALVISVVAIASGGVLSGGGYLAFGMLIFVVGLLSAWVLLLYELLKQLYQRL